MINVSSLPSFLPSFYSIHQFTSYHLIIDCEELINVPEHEMLSRLATQVGFYPQLNFMVSASGIIDTLIAATTGAKSGNFKTLIHLYS